MECPFKYSYITLTPALPLHTDSKLYNKNHVFTYLQAFQWHAAHILLHFRLTGLHHLFTKLNHRHAQGQLLILKD